MKPLSTPLLERIREPSPEFNPERNVPRDLNENPNPLPMRRRERQRILVCAQYFHEDKLGGYRRLANFLEGNSDWDFLLPSHRVDGRWAARSYPWNRVVPIEISPNWPLRGLLWGWVGSSLAYWRCLRNKRSPVDAVFITAPPAWWGLPAAIMARIHGTPCVLDLGDPAKAVELGRYRFPKVLAERIVRALSSQVIVASPDMASPGDAVVVTGVGDSFFRAGGRKTLARANGNAEPQRVIYSGSVSHPQGLLDFLEQWGRFGSTETRVELKIIGRGDSAAEETTLKNAIANEKLDGRVKFGGWVPPDEIPAQLREADWGLVLLRDTARFDYCIPTKMLEYLAAGLPILGIAGTRVRKIIEESGAGVWIPRSESSARNMIARFESTLSMNARPFSEKGRRYAGTHLRRKEYQTTIGEVLRKLASPERKAIHLGMGWLEKHAFVRFGEAPSRMIGVRHTPRTFFPRKEANWVYPEITAYAASLYAGCFSRSGDRSFFRKAKAMGRWLRSVQRADGGLPFAHNLETGRTVGPNYSFDTGMAIRAWLTLDRLDPSEEWREAARRSGAWLVERTQSDEGWFRASDGEGVQRELSHDWPFGDRGVLHLKLLLPLKDLARRFPDCATFGEAYDKLLRWGLSIQRSDGAFPIGRGWDTVFTHTHLYALEGLTGSPKDVRPLKRGLDWALEQLGDSGGLPEFVSPDRIGRTTFDATAQLLRLLSLTSETENGSSEHYREAASRIAGDLMNRQTSSGMFKDYSRKRFRSTPPTWSILFALSGLMHWEDRRHGLEWLF